MDFFKSLFIFLMVLAAVAFSGCAMIRQDGNEVFFAVSGKYGIYKFEKGLPPVEFLKLPGINYIVKSKRHDLYYAALGEVPRKKVRCGAIAAVDLKKKQIVQIFELPGATPSHITISPDEKYLYIANYSAGSICVAALDEKGRINRQKLIKHCGRSVHRRQRSPHPHQCLFNPADGRIYVCDLGTDEIFIYDYCSEKGIKTPCREKLKLAPGAGPRHLVFAPDGNVLYCANELDSTVTSFVRKNGKWQLGETHSTLKKKSAKPNYPGAIKISGCGKFFLVSNRGDNSIALFETFEDGKFALIKTVPARGDFPYDIVFLANDRLAAICNYKSNSVVLFSFNKKTKELEFITQYAVPQVNTLVD